jgi:PP-loop superfamily ATP-utilizing enzyme
MADGSHNQGALSKIDPEPFLAKLCEGRSTTEIAKELGVSHQAIQAWMLRETGERYHEAITAALVHRVAEADQELKEAQDAVAIARARERARFARMDLERRRPGLYGQRTQVTHEVGPDLGDLLRDAKARVSRIAPAQITDQSQVIDVQPISSATSTD